MPTPTQALIIAVAAQLPNASESPDAKAAHDALATLYTRVESVELCLPRLRDITKGHRHTPAIMEFQAESEGGEPRRIPVLRRHPAGEWHKHADIVDRLAAVEREWAK